MSGSGMTRWLPGAIRSFFSPKKIRVLKRTGYSILLLHSHLRTTLPKCCVLVIMRSSIMKMGRKRVGNPESLACRPLHQAKMSMSVIISLSQSTSPTLGSGLFMFFSSQNKRNGSGIQNPKECDGAPAGSPRNSKKPKSENSSVGRHAKVN